jgi:hypothetical protein
MRVFIFESESLVHTSYGLYKYPIVLLLSLELCAVLIWNAYTLRNYDQGGGSDKVPMEESSSSAWLPRPWS